MNLDKHFDRLESCVDEFIKRLEETTIQSRIYFE